MPNFRAKKDYDPWGKSRMFDVPRGSKEKFEDDEYLFLGIRARSCSPPIEWLIARVRYGLFATGLVLRRAIRDTAGFGVEKEDGVGKIDRQRIERPWSPSWATVSRSSSCYRLHKLMNDEPVCGDKVLPSSPSCVMIKGGARGADLQDDRNARPDLLRKLVCING